MPTCRLSAETNTPFVFEVTSSSPITISPESGTSSPAKHRRRVLLPHPLGPTIEKNSPSSISMDTLSRALTPPKIFDVSVTLINPQPAFASSYSPEQIYPSHCDNED